MMLSIISLRQLAAGALTLTLMACQSATTTKTTATAGNSAVGYIEIYDQRALEFIDSKRPAEVLAGNFEWTEGPLWVEDGNYLLFSDIPRNMVMKYKPDSAELSVYLDNSGWTENTELSGYGSNGLLLNEQGELVLMQTGQRQVAVMDAPLDSPKPNYRSLAARHHGKRFNSPNDAVFHSNGDLYFTDPGHGLNPADGRVSELGYSGVYRIDTNGELLLLDDSLSFPNGIALSRDEKTLYVAVSDADKPAWYAFDVQQDGRLANKRLLHDAKPYLKDGEHHGLPDGMVLHSSGVLFATGPGGVWLFDEQGKVLARVFTGQLTSNAELNADESMLYLTADDYLMQLPLNK
ncbi:SMP-30/gluconolactonase/LRE family protein [Agaribacterium haliotis]|uniref:SMP-30/gluconolactonase/LRE family protein n=1 Tax=Agaribacterium haliotis TaxID=2013869 RepID=UPI000BB59C28|nr:SMP-30/gluconolactonase/LRE family protein [Agaribacterium haliotis]